MATSRNDHGQAPSHAINGPRLDDRTIDELIGICRGFLADGEINKLEAEFLLRWMKDNRGAAEQWPTRDLYRRLREMLVDHNLDLEEQGELLDTLLQLTGASVAVDGQLATMSSALPLCSPLPTIVFPSKQFCLTGKFAYGSRKQCEVQIVLRHGQCQSGPSRGTAFLVIGTVGSSEWIHSSYGRKIEEAVELRSSGTPIAIVSEEHWVRALESVPA